MALETNTDLTADDAGAPRRPIRGDQAPTIRFEATPSDQAPTMRFEDELASADAQQPAGRHARVDLDAGAVTHQAVDSAAPTMRFADPEPAVHMPAVAPTQRFETPVVTPQPPAAPVGHAPQAQQPYYRQNAQGAGQGQGWRQATAQGAGAAFAPTMRFGQSQAGASAAPAVAAADVTLTMPQGLGQAQGAGWQGTHQQGYQRPAGYTPGWQPAYAPAQPEAVPVDQAQRPSAAARVAGFFRSLLSFLILLAVVAGCAWLLRTYVVAPYEIPSSSMEPTIMVEDTVFSEKVSYYFRPVAPGDIVTFEDPEVPGRTLIKRCIATEGQTIDLVDGVVYVDGVPEDAAYTEGKPSMPLNTAGNVSFEYPYTVPAGCIWVMGDNRTNSADSRYFGAVPASSVTGRACLVYWPIERIRVLG